MIKSDTALKNNRQSWADVCRIVAILGVIIIHACGTSFYKFGKMPFWEWTSINALDSFVRCAVPLFAMLSGALLLNAKKEPSSLKELGNRLLKVIVPLVFWDIIYMTYVAQASGTEFVLLEMFYKIPMYHLWFVYMIIGLYILLPMFEMIHRSLVHRRDLQIYLLIVWFIVSCLPIYFYLPIFRIIYLGELLHYGGYFLIGGIIKAEYSEPKKLGRWVLLYLIGVLFTFGITQVLSQRDGATNELAYMYFSPNVFLASFAAFFIFSRLSINPRYGKALAWVSDRTFLVFFIHVLVLNRIENHPLIIQLQNFLPTSFCIVLIAIGTFVVSLAVAAVLRLIPFSRRVLG